MGDKKKYNGVLTLAFSINFNEEDGSDITDIMILDAIKGRIHNLIVGNDLVEACGAVEDIIEND